MIVDPWNENVLPICQGWSTVYGYNMSCLKNYVMREPLVDTVDKRQICTDHFPLQVISGSTCSI